MALESVDYSEEKACKILEIVMQDDKSVKSEIKQEVKEDASVENESAPPLQNDAIPDSAANNDERYFKLFSFIFFVFHIKFFPRTYIKKQLELAKLFP